MQRKNIWLVNKYAMPPQYEARLQTIKFAHYLTKMGHNVTIFACSIMHNLDIDLINDGSLYIERQYGDLRFVHIRSFHYDKTANFKRVLSEICFHYNLVRIANKFKKPDVIVAATNALISNPVLSFAKKYGIKYITQSLDVWPDNFVDFGLVSSWNPIVKYLFWRTKKTYKESDVNVFSWSGCYRYMKNKKWDKDSGGPIDLSKVYYINNGVDLKDFNKWKTEYILDDEDLKLDKKRIIYLGSIRLVNNVIQLIKAAEKLKDRADVEFLIYGNGEDREALINYCAAHGITNVKFKAKWTDPKFVPFILTHSYINILNYVSSDFGKNGISSSKLFQYMASGRPIVCNIDIYECPIKKNNIGIAHAMQSEDDYADAIRTLLSMPKADYDAMCERARHAAQAFDYEFLTNKLAQLL